MAEAALTVTRLGKIFNKGTRPHSNSIREEISGWFGQITGIKKQPGHAATCALEDISFTLHKGDILGIVGKNGAGKSTLLKVLAGIVKPGSGTVEYTGRLLSILELGAGFHPDLTGRENVYLNGTLLGLSTRDIKQKFDDIVAFSELENSIDQPVKQYSSGMYLRLAFAIFAHIQADILLLDEVMSVGDLQFQQKCHRKILELANSGTTILLISHNPDQIIELCNKCIWIDNGKTAGFGPPSEIIGNYVERLLLSDNTTEIGRKNNIIWPQGFPVGEEIKVYSFGIMAKGKTFQDDICDTDEMVFIADFEKMTDEESIEITVTVMTMHGAWVLVDSYGMYQAFQGKVVEKGRYKCQCSIPAGLLNRGVYQIGYLVSKSNTVIFQCPNLLGVKIQYTPTDTAINELAIKAGSIIKPPGIWNIEKT